MLLNQENDANSQMEDRYTSLLRDSTVFVVDDDVAVRGSLIALVSALGMAVKAYASGEEFLREYEGQRGCLITDVRMPGGMTGIELQGQLKSRNMMLPVIVITAYAETSLTVHAMQSGAVTLLEKPYRDHELLDAIQSALRSDRIRSSERQETNEIFERMSTLTDSERTVLDLIIDGITNKVIAKRLDVSIRTVENRRQRIYEKMHTDSVADLVRMVVEARTKRRGQQDA